MIPEPAMSGLKRAAAARFDPYSAVAMHIQLCFGDLIAAEGTAFAWLENDQPFLITNWHNVTGKDPNTGLHLSAKSTEPDRLVLSAHADMPTVGTRPVTIMLRQDNGAPKWLIHPEHGRKVDVVAIPLSPNDLQGTGAQILFLNVLRNTRLLTKIGMDVYVLGFPFGKGGVGFPIWKRASIASEPNIGELRLLIDTASRKGMSGSPVIQRSWGEVRLEEGDESGFAIATFAGPVTKFIGVYSGRLRTKNPEDIQLGIVWPAPLVQEIVAGNRWDTE